jgi:deazaflavin-dependent oxidoreductase (nitroreductase family)
VDTRKLDAIAKTFNKIHQWLYRVSKGRLGGKMMGANLVMFTTVGRKTGQPRTTMVGAPIVSHEMIVTLASYAAGERNPQWYYNLLTNPAVTVTVKGDRRTMIAREALGEEKASLWERCIASGTPLDKIQSRTQRAIPLVVLEPAD